MWYYKRVDVSKSTSTHRFNMCCKQGLIHLPPLKPTPPLLKELLDSDGGIRNSKLKDQIRI